MAYSSINANSGYEQCRRDDLESFGYMLISLVQKGLPWTKIKKKNNLQEQVIEIGKLKKGINIEKVCEGLPKEFIDYINYCRKLEFEQEPNYNYLRNLFISILIKENQKNDLKFFWINKKTIRSVSKNNENNYIMRRDTHKRLYNSVKKSLEKKRKEGTNNILKLNCSKSNNSLDEVKDIQNNKKVKLIYKNLNIKSLNDKREISIKNYKTNNNIMNKTLSTSAIDGQKAHGSLKKLKLNKIISNNASCYNLKNQLPKMKIKLTRKICGNTKAANNIFSNSNQKTFSTKNIMSKNYNNLEDNINKNLQIEKVYINNFYYNEIGYQTPSKMIPEIHYRSIFRNLKPLEYKNRFKNYNAYSFQNNSTINAITDMNKNNFENHSIYSFQNNSKNNRTPNNKKIFGNHSIFSLQNNLKKY